MKHATCEVCNAGLKHREFYHAQHEVRYSNIPKSLFTYGAIYTDDTGLFFMPYSDERRIRYGYYVQPANVVCHGVIQ